MELVQQPRVLPLELVERNVSQTVMSLLDAAQRVSGALAVIEQGIVQIEQNGADHGWATDGRNYTRGGFLIN
jgi:hypothetical protein